MRLVTCAMVLIAVSIWSAATASAVTYNYVGRPEPSSGNYLTASVDLNCVAPCAAGDYFEFSSGINSWSLMAHSSSHSVLATVSSETVVVLPIESVVFLRLDPTGAVTNWSLFRAGDGAMIQSFGFSPSFFGEGGDPIQNAEFALSDGVRHLGWSAPGSLNPPVGVWAISEAPLPATSEVPLPAALPLFATILAGGGLIAWRRKRKAAARERSPAGLCTPLRRASEVASVRPET